MSDLTAKQQKFVLEYLVDLNATQAAIRAGYSKDSAANIGYENVIKPDIQKAIQEAQEKHRDKNNVTIAEITKMHRKAYKVGKLNDIPSAMTASANNLAKLHGLIVDKSEVTNKGAIPVEVIESEYVD